LGGRASISCPRRSPPTPGYWNEQMDEVVANKHISVLVAPDKGTRGAPKR
jgi:hypothetical protein